jgi:uncharacterized membrane protein (DUF106 family)
MQIWHQKGDKDTKYSRKINQVSVKFVKKSWKNLMDTTFGLCIRDSCPIILIFIFMREKSCLEVVALYQRGYQLV